MEESEYKEFTVTELIRMVEILTTLSQSYIDLIGKAETERACEFFSTRVSSAKHDAIGFRKEWIRRRERDLCRKQKA